MALQDSGVPISLDDVQTEFDGTNPISISEYYSADTGVPASGTISLSDFYSTSAAVVGDIGIISGGWVDGTGGTSDGIHYYTISTTSNAAFFGNSNIILDHKSATSNGSNARGIFAGGVVNFTVNNHIEYITITTTGNALDFGDMTISRAGHSSTSNGTNNRGVFAGGGQTPGPRISAVYQNVIDYVTITTTGNATDFGDLTAVYHYHEGTSNGTNNRGVFGGGETTSAVNVNVIDYITINTTGNATDFGDLTSSRENASATSNGTSNRGVFIGGNASTTYLNVMDYITINTTSNALDFGDLTSIRSGSAVSSNNTKAGIAGGFDGTAGYGFIDYITIATTGNATQGGTVIDATNARDGTSNA